MLQHVLQGVADAADPPFISVCDAPCGFKSRTLHTLWEKEVCSMATTKKPAAKKAATTKKATAVKKAATMLIL